MKECKIFDAINGNLTIGGSSGDASFIYLDGKTTTSRGVKDAIEHAVSKHDCIIDKLTTITKQRDEFLRLSYELVETLKSIGNDCGAEDTLEHINSLLAIKESKNAK